MGKECCGCEKLKVRWRHVGRVQNRGAGCNNIDFLVGLRAESGNYSINQRRRTSAIHDTKLVLQR